MELDKNKKNIVAHLDDCEESIDNKRSMVKRSLYLHK